MNLITAVLVEKAIQTSQLDVETERHLRRQKLTNLRPAIRQVFRMLDCDGSGSITKAEALEAVTCRGGVLGVPKIVQHIFKPDSIMELFDVLDSNQAGEIGEDDFVDSVMQMAMTEVPLESRQMLQAAKVIRRKVDHVQSMMRFLILESCHDEEAANAAETHLSLEMPIKPEAQK